MTEKTPIELAVEDAQKKRALVKQEASASFLEQVNIDWTKCPPMALARLIRAVPYGRDREGNGLHYSDEQAIILGQSCYSMGLNPFRNHAYLNPKTNKLALYVEGQQELARLRGIKIGPARYIELTRPFPTANKYNAQRIACLKELGFTEDIGIKCEIEVLGFKNQAESIVWASEWLVPHNEVWKDRISHMLRTRAKGKALAEVTGAEISEDIQANEQFQAEVIPVEAPQIVTSPVELAAMAG